MFNNIANYNGKVAIVDEFGNSLTYDELEQISQQVGAVIKDRCVVFSLCENMTGSAVGYISFLKNHIVPLMLSSKIDKELFNNLFDSYKPTYLWMPKAMADEFNQYEAVYEKYEYVLLKTQNEPYCISDELALLLTTSGSTGSPKLVRQSYTNLLANTKSIIEYLELTEDERAITTLPMSYTYGLSIINTHITAGAMILLTDKNIFSKDFWDFFKANEATSFGGVPYTYEMLDKMRFFRMDLPSLRYMTQAGGKLSPELHKKFAEYAAEKGKKFIVMYGQTEATARMAYLPSEKSIEKYGSMGIAIPGGIFELIDVNGNVIEENEVVGELVYRGENVTLGYAECKDDLNKGDERGGVLVTGDMAKRDKDGFFFIVGRKKRFLKIFGNRVNLDELEGILKAEYAQLDCACAGVDDNAAVYVVNKENQDEAELTKSIKEFIANKTHISTTAFAVKFVDEIPKNEAGKVLYSNLK